MSTIPLIDIAPFLDGTDKKGVASLVDTACRDMGFLMVKGHGVYRELIAGMHRVSKAYFARPFWEKMQFKIPADRYRGYTPLGAESLCFSDPSPMPKLSIFNDRAGIAEPRPIEAASFSASASARPKAAMT